MSKFCLPVAILQGICWLEHDANKVWLEMSLNNQIQKDVETEEKWKAIRKISDTDPEYTVRTGGDSRHSVLETGREGGEPTPSGWTD